MPCFPHDWDGGKWGECKIWCPLVVFPFLPAFLFGGGCAVGLILERLCYRFDGHWIRVDLFY